MHRLSTWVGACALTIAASFLWLAVSSPMMGAAEAQSEEVDTSGIVEMVLGDPNAPVEMIEYASYTCPHCAAFHEGAYKNLKADYIDTGKVKFVYREVYFDKYGLWASMVARCAGPDRFFGINDMIYETQRDWTRAGDEAAIAAALRKIGLLAGVEPDQLDACMRDGDKARTLVAWFQENVTEHDITATPSFVINGSKVSNQSWDDLSALLDAELGS